MTVGFIKILKLLDFDPKILMRHQDFWIKIKNFENSDKILKIPDFNPEILTMHRDCFEI